MDAIAAFLITLGVIGVMDLTDRESRDVGVSGSGRPPIEQPTEQRNRRIELTNAFLRSLRQFPHNEPLRTVIRANTSDPPG